MWPMHHAHSLCGRYNMDGDLVFVADVDCGEIGKRNRVYSRVKRSKSTCVKTKKKNGALIRDFSVRQQKLNLKELDSTNTIPAAETDLDTTETQYSPKRTLSNAVEWTYSPLHTPEPSSEIEAKQKVSNGHVSPSEKKQKVLADSNRVEEISRSISPEVPVFCAKCKEQIKDLAAVEFEDMLFHVGCFSCAKCSAIIELGEQEMLVMEGAPLCYACSPTCWECNKKITESHMRVLDQDFHEDCLRCTRCDKPLKDNLKIYASEKHPCCAACTIPVFSKHPPIGFHRPPSRIRTEYRSFQQHKIHLSPESKTSGSRSPTPRRHRSVTPDPINMKHLSQSDPTLDISVHFEPYTLPSVSHTPPRENKMSCSSLDAVLHDELGFSLLCSFCTKECSIELVMFWLDVENFKQYDGDQEDLRLIAQHIALKYIAYAADMPLCLPRGVENRVMRALEMNVTLDMFDEAQKYVYGVMEGNLHRRFLFSEDGLQYLESIVKRDIERRRQSRAYLTVESVGDQLKAVVTDFDKRHAGSKYYVYRIEVSMPTQTYVIYRRYSEFNALHQQLKSDHPRHRLPSLPKKILFGRSQVRTVAAQRMVELQRYLKELLNMPHEISMGRTLLNFLRQTQSDIEDESFDKRVQRFSTPMF